MKGYPPGTRCVITFSTFPENPRVALGQVVTVGPYVAPPGRACFVGPLNSFKRNKQWKQELTDVPAYRKGGRFIYPIDWMRPIDKDTDEDDQEVIRQMNTIRVRDRVTKLDPAWGEGVER